MQQHGQHLKGWVMLEKNDFIRHVVGPRWKANVFIGWNAGCHWEGLAAITILIWGLRRTFSDSLFLEGIHSVVLGCSHKKWQQWMKKKKTTLERKVQILHTFSPPHSWPITAWSGCEWQIVRFGKQNKNCQTQPPPPPKFWRWKGVRKGGFRSYLALWQALLMEYTRTLTASPPGCHINSPIKIPCVKILNSFSRREGAMLYRMWEPEGEKIHISLKTEVDMPIISPHFYQIN